MSGADLSPTLMASSAQRKPQISITLPRNFAPLGLDGSDEPKTPDQTFAELKLPPPPHHSTLRIRRPRVNMENFQSRNNALPATLFASDIPIPSSGQPMRTEFSLPSTVFDADTPLASVEPPSSPLRPSYHHSISEPIFSDRLLLPAQKELPPRTPPTQTKITPEYKHHAWGMHRAASVCSVRSDSSVSSCGTFTTRPTSFDGSATSPDLDGQDPFSPSKVNIIPDTPSRKSKKVRLNSILARDNTRWTIEMDNHLFNVYQLYLADPTVTPFKTVPGSIPPTGVCHRVARRAKETWPRASLIPTPIIKRYKMRSVFDKRTTARDRTPEPNDFLRTDANDARGTWPSESATRRRLKQLCKEKFTISAHYQRLRESRSPSPFHEQFVRRTPSRATRSVSCQPEDESVTYGTRELGISLVASGATAPLAQLVTGDSPFLDQKSEEWFNTPMENKAQLQPPSGLGIATDPTKLAPAATNPRLASPFNYSTWNGRSNKSTHRRQVSQNQWNTMHATGSRLLSPFRPETDMSLNANKRRAQHNLEDELSPSGSNIGNRKLDVEIPSSSLFDKKDPAQDLFFSGAGDINQRRIRMRNRGATLGAVSNQERIERLFTPPIIQTPTPDNGSGIPPVPSLPPSLTSFAATSASSSHLHAPEIDPMQRRLGSPFEMDSNKRSYRSKPSRHVPSLSDPFISTSSFDTSTNTPNQRPGSLNLGSTLNMSIGERLAMFDELHRRE